MSYAHHPQPRHAANDNDHALRYSPMTRRRPKPLVSRPVAALNRINLNCKCKVTMVTSCILNQLRGCDCYREAGSCACPIRLRPACILDPATPHGCEDWAIGLPCACERVPMPRCLVTGCKLRQKGRRCDERHCSRTPVGSCPHLQAELYRYKDLTPEDAGAILAIIVRELEIIRPRAYREPRRPSAGVTARAGAAAVALMQRRRHHGLRIFSPEDVRYIDDEAVRRRQEKRIEAGFRKLAQAVLGAEKGSAS